MLTADQIVEEFSSTLNEDEVQIVENVEMEDEAEARDIEAANDTNKVEIISSSSSSTSDISLSEKIIIESNEKRLRKRISSLQLSITNLKDQLKAEKVLWLEDFEKIKQLKAQNEILHTLPMNFSCSRDSFGLDRDKLSSCSVYSFCSNYNYDNRQFRSNSCNRMPSRSHLSIKHLLELQDYKRKLAETEQMCNMEMLKIKQSLEDLKILQAVTNEWAKLDEYYNFSETDVHNNDSNVEEIYFSSTNEHN